MISTETNAKESQELTVKACFEIQRHVRRAHPRVLRWPTSHLSHRSSLVLEDKLLHRRRLLQQFERLVDLERIESSKDRERVADEDLRVEAGGENR